MIKFGPLKLSISEAGLSGKNRGKEFVRITNAPLLGKILIKHLLAKLCDSGDIELLLQRYHEDLSKAIRKVISKKKNKYWRQDNEVWMGTI